MSITLISSPQDVSAALNEMRYKLSTNNYRSVTGVKSNISVLINNDVSGPVNDETFSIAWTDAEDEEREAEFTFKTSPAAAGEIMTLLAYDAAKHVEKWVKEILIPGMLSNYYLSRDYNVIFVSGDADTATLKIEAKNYGSNYDIDESESATEFSFSDNNTSSDESLRSNFQIFMQIFVEREFGSGLYVQAGERSRIPDADNVVYFYIEKILQNYLSGDVPKYGQDEISFASNMLKNWYAQFFESYGNTPVDYNFITDSVKYALLAGLSKQKSLIDDFNSDYAESGSGKLFLTNIPDSTDISKNGHYYLYMYVPTNGTYTVKIKMYYSDGSNKTCNAYDAFSIKAKQVAIIPAGYTQLDIDSLKDAGKTVYKYELYVTGDMNTVTKMFVIDNSVYNNERFYLYMNSLGGFDTFRTTGDIVLNMEFEKEELKLFRDETDPYFSTNKKIAANIITRNYQYKNAYEVYSGFVSKEHVHSMIELLNSNYVYELLEGYYVPVLVNSSDNIYDSESDIHGIKLNVKYAFDEEGFIDIL